MPEGVDGKVTGEVRPRPRLPVSVRIGGSQAGLPYVGAAPGMVAGVLQVNARVPSEIASGNSVAVLLSVGSAASQPGVTMAVR